MRTTRIMNSILLIGALILTGCAGGPLSTREKGAGIGALGGAAAGGLVGAAVGHPGAGAAVGGALGLGTGALVGDQLQGQETPITNNSSRSIGIRPRPSETVKRSSGCSAKAVNIDLSRHAGV